MKLAFYIAEGTGTDKLIRFITNSQYSHCELVIDNICYSSSVRDNGVRMKYIYLDPKSWHTVTLPETYDQTKALTWFTKNVGKPYDTLGAITSILPVRFRNNDKYFCSEACAEMLGLPDPRQYTPQSLLDHISK